MARHSRKRGVTGPQVTWTGELTVTPEAEYEGELVLRSSANDEISIVIPGALALVMVALHKAYMRDKGARTPRTRGYRRPGMISASGAQIREDVVGPSDDAITSYVGKLRRRLRDRWAEEGRSDEVPQIIETCTGHGYRIGLGGIPFTWDHPPPEDDPQA